jgi:hypothetical protein
MTVMPPSFQMTARNIVLYIWYDNEYGYSHQVRLAKYIAKVRRVLLLLADKLQVDIALQILVLVLVQVLDLKFTAIQPVSIENPSRYCNETDFFYVYFKENKEKI